MKLTQNLLGLFSFQQEKSIIKYIIKKIVKFKKMTIITV